MNELMHWATWNVQNEFQTARTEWTAFYLLKICFITGFRATLFIKRILLLEIGMIFSWFPYELFDVFIMENSHLNCCYDNQKCEIEQLYQQIFCLMLSKPNNCLSKSVQEEKQKQPYQFCGWINFNSVHEYQTLHMQINAQVFRPQMIEIFKLIRVNYYHVDHWCYDNQHPNCIRHFLPNFNRYLIGYHKNQNVHHVAKFQ